MTDPDEVRPTQLPVVQPDPMLRETRAGWLRMLATLIGGAVVVVLVLYGMTRPAHEPQLAATPEASETAPAQNAQPNRQPPTTTGQGSGRQDSGKDGGQTQNPAGQAGPPAAGGAATSTVGGPSAKPMSEPH